MKDLLLSILVAVLFLLLGCGGEGKEGSPAPGGGGKPGPQAPAPGEQPPAEPGPGKVPPGQAGQQPPTEPSRPAPGPAQEPEKPAPEPGPAAALDAYLVKHGVHLDREKERVWVKGRIQITNDYLEYLAVCRRGKDHESLLLVECLPSALNAALIALGLEKGTNYSLKEKLPAPPKEEVEAGRAKPYVVVHPEGPGLYLTVEWEDDQGRKVRRRAEELVLDLRAKKPLEKRTWTYFGSRMAPLNKGEEPVFMADQVFNLVSVCYMFPGNHLITIRHENGMDQSNWYPNYEELPPKGTPVRLYFSLAPLE